MAKAGSWFLQNNLFDVSNTLSPVVKFASVPDYEVTTPFQADEAGNLLSYKLHSHGRQKRSADQSNAWYFNVQAFGLSMHLNVTKNRQLIGTGSLLETTHKNGSKTYSQLPQNSFYNGHVTSHPDSLVAVSNDGGLVSLW